MRAHFLAAPAVAALILGCLAALSPGPTAAQGACDPHYDGVCLPVFAGVDNIACTDDIVTLSKFPAREPDPYKLDQGGVPGVACEDNGKPAYQAPTGPTATATRSSNTLPR